MRARIATFKVEVTAVDGVPQSAVVRLPHHDGIQFSESYTEAELFAWIKKSIKKYLREQTRAAARAARARALRLHERRATEADDSR